MSNTAHHAEFNFELPNVDNGFAEWITRSDLTLTDASQFKATKLTDSTRLAEIRQFAEVVRIREVVVELAMAKVDTLTRFYVGVVPATATKPTSAAAFSTLPGVRSAVASEQTSTGVVFRFPIAGVRGVEDDLAQTAIRKGHPVVVIAGSFTTVPPNTTANKAIARVHFLVECNGLTYSAAIGGGAFV